MKKYKVAGIIVLLFVIMCVTSGCGTYTEVGMNTEGKGSLKIKLEIPKDEVENGDFAGVKTPEELVKLLEEKTSDTLNLEFCVDKESSVDKDYIVVSLNYDSIEEYNEQISETIMQYNMLVSSSDFEDMFGYIPSVDKTNVYENEAVKKYFEENGFTVDTTNRNVRKLVKIIKSCLVFDEDTIENNERLKFALNSAPVNIDTKSNQMVDIIDNAGEKELQIQQMAIDCLTMYMRRVLIKYQNELFDVNNINAHTEAINGAETKEILYWVFGGVSLAEKVKESFNEKGITEYELANLTPVMAAKIFDDTFTEEFRMAWNREYNNFQEEKRLTAQESEGFINIESMVFKEWNKSVTLKFGDTKVEYTNDEFYNQYEDSNYIVISSKTSSDSEETGIVFLPKHKRNINQSVRFSNTIVMQYVK